MQNLPIISLRVVQEGVIPSSGKAVHTPEDAIACVQSYLQDRNRETALALFLKTDGTPIGCQILTYGSIGAAYIPVGEMMKTGLLCNAAKCILVHNHPSGCLHPSKADIQLTANVIKAGRLLEIPLLDHIIVGPGTTYYSLQEKRELELVCPPSNQKVTLQDLFSPEEITALVAEQTPQLSPFEELFASLP